MNDIPRHVLVIKPSSLGDIIHTLPAVAALKQRFSQAKITWLVKKPWAEILEGNPDIDQVLAIDFSLRSWPSLIRRLRQNRFDLALDFQGLFRSGLLSRLSGACRRVGFAQAREGAPVFYTDLVSLPSLDSKSWRLGALHAVDRNLALAAHEGADLSKAGWNFPDFPEDRLVVQELLKREKLGREETMIAVAPWSRASLKCWPLEHFFEIVTSLLGEKGIRPCVVGGKDVQNQSTRFRELERQGMINMIGKLSLRQLPVLLRQMKGFIGNDSALLHMATALGIPVVGLYGPTSPLATGPYPLDRHVTLRKSLSCSPCGKRSCLNTVHQECMKTIQPEEVLNAFHSLCETTGVRSPRGGEIMVNSESPVFRKENKRS